MVDQIKPSSPSGSNRSQRNTRSSFKSSSQSTSDTVDITNQVGQLVQQIIDMPPTLNAEKIDEIKTAILDGDYDLDSEQIAKDFIKEYYKAGGRHE